MRVLFIAVRAHVILNMEKPPAVAFAIAQMASFLTALTSSSDNRETSFIKQGVSRADWTCFFVPTTQKCFVFDSMSTSELPAVMFEVAQQASLRSFSLGRFKALDNAGRRPTLRACWV